MSDDKPGKRRDSVSAAGPYNRVRIAVFLVVLLIALVVIVVRAVSGGI
ncbi:hypothetical protein KZZ07_00200 [Mameliella sp. CS4]|nr:hypothetical protein [Mameliella sp. CS4]MBW4980946.1 hypothetical protein [Mameliella sp. CS4]